MKTKFWKRQVSLLLAGVLFVSAFAGCGNKKADESVKSTLTPTATEAPDQEESSEITVTDQAGRTVTLDAPAERIVSAYYISTATLIALGCEDNLVGIEMKADTRELYKLAAPQLLELPAVGSGKGINVEETAALKPDLVIIPLKLQESAASFEALDIPVFVVNPETQEDFESCVGLLAELCGQEEQGEALLSYYQDSMEKMKDLTADLEDKPLVYLSSGSSYLSTCTSKMYQNDLIEMAGGVNVSSDLQEGYWQDISAEQLLEWNPEYIFPVSYAEYSLDDIRQDSALAEVMAVKEDKIYTFPSEIEPWDYPTPSSVLGVLWLTQKLHPDLYSEEEYVEEAKSFYQTFFDIDVTEEQLGL